jgi:hypothetical protein
MFMLMEIEWRFQLWTPKGHKITIYKKPKDCSWFLINSLREREQIDEA